MPAPGILECTFHYLSDAQLHILEDEAKSSKHGTRAVPMRVAESLSLAERQVVFNHLNDEGKRKVLLAAIDAYRKAQAKR